MKNLPSLFCEIGQQVRLKTRIELNINSNIVVFEPNSIFEVIDIVGYGIDLSPMDKNEDHNIRLLNSEMSEYFDLII